MSGIVIGQGKPKTASHSFWLTFVYVQGMAITYSLLGLVVAVAGAQFQAALQHPVVLETTEKAPREVPDYIEFDKQKIVGRLIRVPKLSDVPYPVQMEPNLVVEFYSR